MNVLSVKSIKSALITFLVAVLLLVGASANIAYADTIDGGGGSENWNGATGAGGVWKWTGKSGSSYKYYTVAGFNSNSISNSDFYEYTRAYACTDFSNWNIKGASGIYSDKTGGLRSWGIRGNWSEQGTSVLSRYTSDLLNSNLTNDTITLDANGILWSKNYNNYLSAVWIDPSKEYTPVTTSTYREVIVKVEEDDGDGSSTTYDETGQSAEWKYKYGITSYDYAHTTAAENRKESWTVTAVIQVVEYIYSYDYNEATGEKKNETYTYKVVNTETVTRTFDYSVTTPTITQEKYTPLNLNRNGYATSEDIDATYANAETGIDAKVDNQQGITDNSDLNALDINNSQEFTFIFNNYTFGLPSKYNWANTPDELSNGTYEYVTVNGEYANGHNNNADEDGYLRYNLKFYASISNNTADSSEITSSLTINNNEYTANQYFSDSYDGSDDTWTGSGEILAARFIYMDTYYTDNNLSGSSFTNWWVTTYSQSRFYEYGSSWYGRITSAGSTSSSSVSSSSGIQDPTVLYGTWTKNSTTKSGTDTITTTADNLERGLYIGLMTVNFEQPILYGHWAVVTVAGTYN